MGKGWTIIIISFQTLPDTVGSSEHPASSNISTPTVNLSILLHSHLPLNLSLMTKNLQLEKQKHTLIITDSRSSMSVSLSHWFWWNSSHHPLDSCSYLPVVHHFVINNVHVRYAAGQLGLQMKPAGRRFWTNVQKKWINSLVRQHTSLVV